MTQIQEGQRYTINGQNLICKNARPHLCTFYICDEGWELVMTTAGSPHPYPALRLIASDNPDLKRV